MANIELNREFFANLEGNFAVGMRKQGESSFSLAS
jgi:hypothetical protein